MTNFLAAPTSHANVGRVSLPLLPAYEFASIEENSNAGGSAQPDTLLSRSYEK